MSQAFDGGEPTMPLASGEIETGTQGDIEIETERRRSPRSPLVVRIAYATVDALFTEFTKNVNEGGLFIETESPPPLDTRVALEFKLPGTDTPIRARGRVAWLRAASPEEGPAGIGVEFEQLGSEARESIDALVRQLRAAGK